MSIDRTLISLGLILTSWLRAENPPTRPTDRSAKPLELVKQQAVRALGVLPLVFEPNRGQTDPQVRFLTRAAGMTSFLTDRENVMVLSRHKETPDASDPHKTPEIEQTVVRMKLEGSRVPQDFVGQEKLESISNYFIGNVPSKWVIKVPNYRQVRASSVYPGIDLIYYGDGRKIEYDFMVHPGADPGRIHLAYEGADSLNADKEGNLLIATRLGTLVQRKPLVYQEINGERREVHASYSIRAGRVEFALANWDRRRDLVIDPVLDLDYSTYLGGSAGDRGYGIAVDSSGAVYVTGQTDSTNFPTKNPFQGAVQVGPDAFVTKLNPSVPGAPGLVYSTYIGGSVVDYGAGIAVNAGGEAYVTGYTNSTNFPITDDAHQKTYGGGTFDAFVLRLNSSGSTLAYSTYLGGMGWDQGNGIAVDSSGEAYVTGYTSSANFPIKAGNAFQEDYHGNNDAFVTKLSTHSADLDYSTYLGGSDDDQGWGIAVNGVGEAYVTGHTRSTNFPTTNPFQSTLVGSQNVFVTKFNADGRALAYSTYVGGGNDDGLAIAVDSTGAAYVTGKTQGSMPITPGAFQPTYGGGTDAYVFKLNPSVPGAAGLVYCTYLGGIGNDYGQGIAIDSGGAAYVTGSTASYNFPITSDALQATLKGPDAFVTKLNAFATAPLIYSTYLGGSDIDQGNGIALDLTGATYVVGFTQKPPGTGDSFPTTSTAYQPTPPGGNDAFVTKLNLPTLGPPAHITVTGGGTQSTTVGTAFGHALEVTVTDMGGDPLPGVPVTFSVPSGPGASATLSPSSPVITNSSGVASVTATANTKAGTYAVTASVTGVTPSATFNLTNLAGSVQTIAFVQQPSDTTAGSTISPVKVKLTDSDGNPISASSISLMLQGGAGPLMGTLTQPTDMSGVATFNDLKINSPGMYTVQATGGGLTTTSSPFNITAGSAVSITAISGFGQTATVGSAYASPLVALVEDAFMNPVPGAQVTFTAPGSGASVTYGGPATVTTDVNGEATSPAMTANGQSGSFQVMASTTGAATAAAFSLTNVAGDANKLAFIQQPTDTAAGVNITPPITVQLEDSFGNAVHMANVPVTPQVYPVAAHMLAPLSFVSQPTDANGLATFSSLSISQVGQYQLLAESTAIASATSNPFNIHAGSASTIVATAGTPQSAIIQTIYGEPLQVTVTDTKGNPLSGVPVVFAAPTSGPSGMFGGQSTVTVPTDAQGHATAVITANSIAGAFGVTASSTAITGTAVFDLTNLPAGSSSLAFVQQPSNAAAGQIIAPPVTVQVRDGSLNPMQVPGIPVFLSLSSGTGTLSGTVVQLTDATGLATFNDLKIGAVGTKTLRAASPQQAPINSNPFQITAGTPTNISVFGGSPQATTVSKQFPALLQARVTDLANNPVSGVSVTFALPTASGPGGTFSGQTTVITDSNGIATAPPLTANTSPGNFVVAATATGVTSPAVFSLTNLPQQSSAVGVTPTSLVFVSEINQAAPPSQTVQVSAGGTVTWTPSASAPWLSVQPANGTGSGQITVSVNPAGLSMGTYTGSIRITDSTGGETFVAVTYTITDKPALVIAPPVLVFVTSSNTITPAAQMLHATSTSRTIAYSVSTKVSTPSGGTWLQVSTAQGQTPGTVTVTANAENLANGVYDGSVLFTPTENTVNSVAVPVTLIVGCGQGGCQLQPTIIAVVNGASFQPGGAPRAIETIFGANLSDAVYLASSYPLPTQLGPTSVTVNGIAAPLFYVSPTQINFEIPSGAPTSTIQVVVNNQATVSSRALRASQGHSSALTVVDPGLFVTPDKRAAALNGDLSPHTAATPIPAGGYVILYLTGEGSVTPAVPDGTPAPVNPLSTIDAPAQVNIGGASAQVTYQGLAPGYAGLAQINAIVPSGLTPGDQPVFITINGVPSNSGVITVK
jgi:adhesin/invasin